MTSSSRRFVEHGILRTLIKIQIIKIMYRLGVNRKDLLNGIPGYGDRYEKQQ
jgi:hypothetical protein